MAAGDRYFDPVRDAGYLPEMIREGSELADACRWAEAEVLRVFTGTLPTALAYVLGPLGHQTRYVYLVGYDVDPALAHPALAEALRYTIAEVATWKYHRMRHTGLASSESAQKSSKAWRPDATDRYPGAALRWLHDFDCRPQPVYY